MNNKATHRSKMKFKHWIYLIIGLAIMGFTGFWTSKKFNLNTDLVAGQQIDHLNGVAVYYNGGVDHVSGRNTTTDGYNLGLKYQCVEFVKRYYHEYLKHKMPNTYGHAKDFFDPSLADGQNNPQRNLIQYTNPSQSKPQIDDLVVFDATILNKYGHVAIISKVAEHEIEIVQQNPGPFNPSREVFLLNHNNKQWNIKNKHILGWLRKNKYH